MSTRLLMLLFFALFVICEGKLHVEIKNELPHHQYLLVHCKSKDDDLGPRTLGYGQSFGFSFNPHFIYMTLFYCSFQWDNKLYYYDIYDDHNPLYCPNYQCKWSVNNYNGPCLFHDETNKYDFCHQWKK